MIRMSKHTTRCLVMLVGVILCIATADAQTAKPSRSPPEPVELTGPPKQSPPPPSPAQRRILESGVLTSFQPEKPETIAPTLRTLNELIAEYPEADLYFMRALVG